MEKFILELELRYREVKNGDDRYRTPKIVNGSMTWDRTPQGINYWQNIYRNLFHNHE